MEHLKKLADGAAGSGSEQLLLLESCGNPVARSGLDQLIAFGDREFCQVSQCTEIMPIDPGSPEPVPVERYICTGMAQQRLQFALLQSLQLPAGQLRLAMLLPELEKVLNQVLRLQY